MKKFYLLLMASVCYVTTIFAQPYVNPTPPCPAAMQAKYYLVPGTTPYYKIFIGNGPVVNPAAKVTLVQPAALGGQPVPDLNNVIFTPLDAFGGATIAYASTYTVHHIEVDFDLSGTHYTCKYLADAGGSLPIKLTSLNGRLNTDAEANISWTSSLEENSFQYEVQRSADGKSFVTVGTVKAAGTSLETVKYSYNDVLPGTGGAYYYRLKMIDIDGTAELSKVVYVNSKKGAGVVTKVFPNPFTSEIQLIGATSSDLTPNNIKVFNVTGQLVKYSIVGANAIAIDVTAPKGLYIVKVKDQTFKLSKQ
ncbi:hypothetical protein Niako_7355 [Niastella koreensis GR20-10]|uniref:Secretion system C-terminal sorting domain-containing protein n=2 Tax=Niastella koreensis TaxID=354356 RepID=G8TE20_NIAKG|nr:T9SS type A sorting domain-containing protein [Niastella koreensis]AEW03568.1 hypothetical protein Niako_7355 [Niastella koreensis GR20-10]